MDFIGNQCPVCHQYFHVGDDVVVCPECGTPHHRECYAQTGHCSNEHLHAEGFEYTGDTGAEEKTDVKICPSCGAENRAEMFFCGKCGSPLSPDADRQDKTDTQNNTGNTQGFPFGAGGFNNTGDSPNGVPFYLDPLGGVPADTDLGDGVNAGEAAKYVKQNTPYYIRIFARIKELNSSRFNFFAAIFPAGYLLYRKMYKWGAFFAAIQLGLMFLNLYIQIAYSSLLDKLYAVIQNSMSASNMMTDYMQFMLNLSPWDAVALYLYSSIDLINFALMIVMGICFNRMYFKHCKKQVLKIKEQAKADENPETLLQTKGGVNIPLTISYFLTYMIVMFVPYFLG